MANIETIIKVFVASPSDVGAERNALNFIVSELNKIWGAFLKIRFDLIKWETDVYPGFSSYSQNVINEQINDDYDVFIAIFWKKIGSPTKMSESGSLEELERAINKFKNHNKSLDIMIYFKMLNVNMEDLVNDQLQKVINFKKKIGEEGGLYREFENTENFKDLLRNHLSKVAQKWSFKKIELPMQESLNTISEDPEITKIKERLLCESEELGYFDYFEMYRISISKSIEALIFIKKDTKLFEDQTIKEIKKNRSIEIRDDYTFFQKMNESLKSYSESLNKYSENIEPKILSFASSSRIAFIILNMSLSLHKDIMLEGNKRKDFYDSINNLKLTALKTYETTNKFRMTIFNMKKLSNPQIKAKKKAVKTLDSFLTELKSFEMFCESILNLIHELE